MPRSAPGPALIRWQPSTNNSASAAWQILDELGYVPASKAGAELLFDVIAIKDIDHTTKRAAIFKAEAKKLGVKVKDIYWTLGEHDGLVILEAPDDETATAAILHLGAMGNVHTTTCRAFTAAEMDKIVSKVHGD